MQNFSTRIIFLPVCYIHKNFKVIISIAKISGSCFVVFFFVFNSIGRCQEKSVIFYDPFDTNSKNWPIVSNQSLTSKIQDSLYNVTSSIDKDWWITKGISTPAEKDFTIAITLKTASTTEQAFAGLIWGRKGSELFEFAINAAGYFRIIEHLSEDTLLEWKAKTLSASIRQGAKQYNRLSVERKKDFYYFHINNSLVCKLPYKNGKGSGIGLSICGQQAAAFDDLIVAIEDEAKPDAGQSPEIKLRKDQYFIFQDNFNNNINRWPEGIRSKIGQGCYTITSGNDSTFYAEKSIAIDPREEFQIEAEFRNIDSNSSNNYGYGIGWADSIAISSFYISNDGHFTIDRYKGKKYKVLQHWTFSSSIKTQVNSVNKMSIAYKQGVYYFYINDDLILKDEHTTRPIEEISIEVGKGQKVSVDYFIVTGTSPDELSSILGTLDKELIQEKEFRNSDHRFVLLESTDTEVYDDGDNYQSEEDDSFEENADTDFISWTILGDLVVNEITVSYAFENDNLMIQNKTLAALNLISNLRESKGNFLIETRYAVYSFPGKTAHGFFLENSEENVSHGIFTDEGLVNVLEDTKGVEKDLMPWSGTGKVNQTIGAMNKYSVLALNDSIYYFINDRQVYKGKRPSFIPDSIIFQILGLQRMELDYLKIYSLK